MSSISLINRVKYNKSIFKIYNYFGSKTISLLRLFLKSNDKLIIFTSFGGRKFDDSPKAIYEAMIADSRFADYQIVWAFINPDAFSIPRGEKIRIDTFTYYKYLLKARAWIHNSSMTRGLNIKGINTFELNSWHGTAIKRLGSDINTGNKSFKLRGGEKNAGVMLAQGQYDVEVLSKALMRPADIFRIIGLPRNDALANFSEQYRLQLKSKLGISKDKKVILYAPTFREYQKDGNDCVMAPPIDLRKWKAELGEEYIFLFRAHYEVVKVMNIVEDDFQKNVSAYPSLNDLMIVSDMLISDYSSIFFDYSIMGKPMMCFAYDYDRYEKERGMYFDIRKELPSESDEDHLIKRIKEANHSELSAKTVRFRDKYVTEYGNASSMAVELFYNSICSI